MDGYFDCLYEYLSENRVGRRVRSLPGYRKLSLLRGMALETLKEQLTPEQLASFERFLAADVDLVTQEEQALFQEAVLLGKWMAR